MDQRQDDSGTTRRRLLRGSLLAGAAIGAAGWRSAPGSPAGPAQRRSPASAPGQPGYLRSPHLRAGTDTIPQIRHVVVLMMENHSYDNKLGMLRRPGADGLRLGRSGRPVAANPYPGGEIQHAFRMPTTCQRLGKPTQTWLASHTQYAHGRDSGFVRSASGPVAMGYWQQEDQPFYYSVARQFPVADRYFCSVLGPTFPNRRYLISATSLGMINDTVPGLTDYPANGTIFDRLDSAGVPWKNYCSLGALISSTQL